MKPLLITLAGVLLIAFGALWLYATPQTNLAPAPIPRTPRTVLQRLAPPPELPHPQTSQAAKPQAQNATNVPQSSTACNGTYSGTYSGNLTVSNGQTCTFTAGGITGNLTLTGGQISLNNAGISGNLQGLGNVTLSGTAIVKGNLTLTGGMLSLTSGASVGGNLTLTGSETFSIGPNVIIKGNLSAQNLPSGTQNNQICGSVVTGNLQYQNNAAPAQLGNPTSCPGNIVTGNLTVQNNTADTMIGGNTVGGNLQDQNNTTTTQVLSNMITGNLQCQSNSTITVGTNTAKQKLGQCTTDWMYSRASLGISLTYPAFFVPQSLNGGGTGEVAIEFQSSGKPLLLAGGALPSGESETDFATGYEIVIATAPYDTTSFDITKWFGDTNPGDTIVSVTPVLVNSVNSYNIVFTGEIGAGKPMIVVPRNGAVYTIGYQSTYDDASPDETIGLQGFYATVASIHFTN